MADDAAIADAPETTSTDVPVWKAELPADVRDDPAIKDIKSVADLAKSAIHAQRMVGAGKVAVPGKNATDEQWGDFWKAAGRPDDAKDYGLENVEAPEGVEVNKDIAEQFAAEAHKLGLTSKQASGLMSWQLAMNKSSAEAAMRANQEQRAEAETALRREWGEAYQQRVELAGRVARDAGGMELIDLMEKTGLGNHPAVIKALAAIGSRMGEDRFLGHESQRSGALTPAQAQEKINEHLADPEFLKQYTKPHVPGHKQAMEMIWSLRQQAFPGGKAVTQLVDVGDKIDTG